MTGTQAETDYPAKSRATHFSSRKLFYWFCLCLETAVYSSSNGDTIKKLVSLPKMKKQIFWFDGWCWLETILERVKDSFSFGCFFVCVVQGVLFVLFNFSLLGWVLSNILRDQYQMLSGSSSLIALLNFYLLFLNIILFKS